MSYGAKDDDDRSQGGRRSRSLALQASPSSVAAMMR
jgi:hypothetical protein